MSTQQGLPIESFTDGDILIPVDNRGEQWLFMGGYLQPIGYPPINDGASRKALPNEKFYRVAASKPTDQTDEYLRILKRTNAISDVEHARVIKILETCDSEARNLIELYLKKLIIERVDVEI